MLTDPPTGGVPVVAIVGNQLRHRWFLSRLAAAEGLRLVGAVVEQKREQPRAETATENDVLRRHFEGRSAAETRFFGDSPSLDDLGVDILRVPFGGSNEPAVAEWVTSQAPAYLSLFGCSIIREQLLEPLALRVVNLHLGLSPYYRGAATNFWPLVNGEPECVGGTVHLATLQVDGGPILKQVRPSMEPDDDAHAIGCRTIARGAIAVVEAVRAYAEGLLEPVPQTPGGRVYRNADFDAGAVEQLWARLRDGMIPQYLRERAARDARYPIIE